MRPLARAVHEMPACRCPEWTKVPRSRHPRLLRTRPNPLSWDQARKLRGARPAGPPPRPSIEPVTVHRRASNSVVIMVVGQKIPLGRTHAHHELTVHVAEHSITVELDDGGHRTFRRTTTQPVRNHKAQKPPNTSVS